MTNHGFTGMILVLEYEGCLVLDGGVRAPEPTHEREIASYVVRNAEKSIPIFTAPRALV